MRDFPYVGILYATEDLRHHRPFDVIYSITSGESFDETKFGHLKLKIYKFDGISCDFVYYDKHHNNFAINTFKVDDYMLNGNILIKV